MIHHYIYNNLETFTLILLYINITLCISFRSVKVVKINKIISNCIILSVTHINGNFRYIRRRWRCDMVK